MSDYTLAIRLTGDAGDLTGEIKLSADAMDDLSAASKKASDKVDDLGDKSDKAASEGKKLNKEYKKLGSTVVDTSGLLGRMGAVLAGMGLGLTIKDLFDTNREMERLHAGLVTVTGSSDLATAALSGIQTFAADTPYQVTEVTEAFTKLVAFGLTPSERALTSYGTTASAMGTDLNQMIEAVADAATGQFERLLAFGIKSASEGDKVTFTFRGVSTTVKKEASAIEGYLLNLGETEFAGGMERQSQTLNGAMSNLSDSWDHLMDTLLSDSASSAIQDWIRGFGDGLRWIADDAMPFFQKIFIAGIATVEKAWLSVETTGSIVWETVKATGVGAINILRESMAGWLDLIANGLDFIGADGMAAKVSDLAEVLKPASSAYEDLKIKINDLNTAHDAEIASIDKAVLATFKSIDGNKKSVASLDDVAKSISNTTSAKDKATVSTNELVAAEKLHQEILSSLLDEAEAAEDALNTQYESTEQLVESLQEELELMQYSGKELAIQTALRKNAKDSVTDYDNSIRQLVGDLYDARQASQALADESSPIAQIFKDTASSIRSSFRGAFRDVLDNGFESFSSLGDRMLNVFKDTLADMATLAATNSIIIPVSGLAGGLLGVSDSAIANVGQQLGGGGDLLSAGSSLLNQPAIFDAIGLSSITSAISTGIGAIGGFGASLAGGAGATQAAMLAAQTAEFGLAGATATGSALGAGAGASSLAAIGSVALPLAAIALIASAIFADEDLPPGMRLSNIRDENEAGFESGDIVSGLSSDGRGYTAYGAFGGLNFRSDDAEDQAEELAQQFGPFIDGIVAVDKVFADMLNGDQIQQVTDALYTGVGSVNREFDEGSTAFIQARASTIAGIAGGVVEALSDSFIDQITNVETFAAFAQLATLSEEIGFFVDAAIATASTQNITELAELGAAYYSAQQAAQLDATSDYTAQYTQANRSLYEVLQDQTTIVFDLTRAFDGSLDSANALAGATSQRYQLELQMLAQIDSVQSSITNTLEATIEGLKTSQMGDRELYNYYRDQAQSLADGLSELVDPADIQVAINDINRFGTSALNVLDESGRAEVTPEFQSFFQSVLEEANAQLDEARDNIAAEDSTLSAEIEVALQRAAEAMVEQLRSTNESAKNAANTLQSAADSFASAVSRPQEVVVTVQYDGSVVGGF